MTYHSRASRSVSRDFAGLPRSARLSRSADFRRVFKDPVRCSNRYFIVLAVPGLSPRARLGLAVAKKNARRAVDRSRLKRLIREVFRRRRDSFGAVDLVIMTRAGAITASNASLREALAKLLVKTVADLAC